MSINALLLGFVGWYLFRHRRYAGQTTLWIIVLYAITRYVIELFRGDALRGLWFDGAMSTSQLISVLAGLGALAFLFKYRERDDSIGDPIGSSE